MVGNNTNATSGNNSNLNLTSTASALQEKYQQSSYYNGFDVFSGKNTSSQLSASSGHSSTTANSLFEPLDCQMHHNCGDDSPPPTVTGYNSYLEGITHTGVIRYDDASFLKNLIPGQQLNNEVRNIIKQQLINELRKIFFSFLIGLNT